MLNELIRQLTLLSEKVPVELYAFIGGLIEEIVAPIPSPLIMTTAGGILHLQGRGILALIFISLLAAAGKTLGAWLIYAVADKAEDILTHRFGKWLGITHRDIESIGRYFDKTWKDDVLLIFLRAFPIIPGAPVAVVCGIIKLNLTTYLRSTFIGILLRNLLLGGIGYGGVANYQTIVEALKVAETAGKVFLVILTLAAIGGFYYLRNHGGLHKWIKKVFAKKEENK